MSLAVNPVSFLAHLPEAFRDDDLLLRFLRPFEGVYAGAQAEIEGSQGIGGSDTWSGGIPDLFGLQTTPPPEFADAGSPAYAFLEYLAGWVGLPLRPERPLAWNRAFAVAALPLLPARGSRAGLRGLLAAWLRGDIVDPPGAVPPILMLSDLAPDVNGGPSAWQLGVTATLGADTVLGLGPPAYVIVDVLADQSASTDTGQLTGVAEVPLRHPVGLDVLQRAARTILDAERPAHISYQLRVRGRTMQLAPASLDDFTAGEVYAQLEDPTLDAPNGTALLWDGLTTYDSD